MHIFERIISLLAPHICLLCGEEGSVLCGLCRLEHISSLPERCYRCHALSVDSRVCHKCRSNSSFGHVWAVTSYEGAPKQVLHRLKFERAAAASEVLVACLDDVLPYFPAGTVITHAPTVSHRIRGRGYDQSALVARLLAKRRGLRYSPLLVRMGHGRQVGLSRAERIKQADGSFRLAAFTSVKGEKVLIIDDILTTGATLEAAARTLRAAGAKTVNGAVFAQKQ